MRFHMCCVQYVGKRREGHTHKKLAEAHYHAVILGKVLRSWQVSRRPCLMGL